MRLRRFWVIAVLVFGLSLGAAFLVLAQEANETAAAAPQQAGNQTEAMPEAPAPASQAQPEEKTTEWVWGEVVSVDPEKKEVVIKHLDYETYEEVQTALKVDDK